MRFVFAKAAALGVLGLGLAGCISQQEVACLGVTAPIVFGANHVCVADDWTEDDDTYKRAVFGEDYEPEDDEYRTPEKRDVSRWIEAAADRRAQRQGRPPAPAPGPVEVSTEAPSPMGAPEAESEDPIPAVPSVPVEEVPVD